LGEKLEGNGAIQDAIPGGVDNTHSTTAEFLEDLVVRDGLANHDVLLPLAL